MSSVLVILFYVEGNVQRKIDRRGNPRDCEGDAMKSFLILFVTAVIAALVSIGRGVASVANGRS
jgi:hypothetical protein